MCVCVCTPASHMFTLIYIYMYEGKHMRCRSQWPRGLRRRSAAARHTHNTHNRQTSMPPVGLEPTISGSWVLIPPGAWMFVCCECCVLSGRGLCDELITSPEESYRL